VEKYILDNIPFQPDLDALAKRVHMSRDSPHFEELVRLAQEAQAIARPKAMYKVGYVESKADRSVVIDGIAFTSRVLRVNLDKAYRVFAYLATCGMELYNWAGSVDDPLQGYWADAIQQMALRSAGQAITAHISQRYRPGQTATMAPGSLSDWPLTEQRPLFSLLGDTWGEIGVRLSDSLLMIPTKSVSGIRFPTEGSADGERPFESCQLCPRPECPGRRAPYDPHLYDRKYRQEGRDQVQ
jgi:hypothetical protein